MKYSDIKDISNTDMTQKIRETKEKLFEAKMKNSMGQSTNPIAVRYMRRDIARLKTALAAKTRGAK